MRKVNNGPKTLTGYVGSQIHARHILGFKKISRWKNDVDPYMGLVLNAGVCKTRRRPEWKEVRITVEVLDHGAGDAPTP